MKSSRAMERINWPAALFLLGAASLQATVNDGTQPVLQYVAPGTGTLSKISVGDIAGGDELIDTLIFRLKNSNKMWLTSAGRVGIGTNAPQYGLDIITSNSADQLRVRSIAASGAPLIKLSGAYNGGNGGELWQDATGIVRLNINGTTNGIQINPNRTVFANKYSTTTTLESAMFTADANSTPYLDFYNTSANRVTRIDQSNAVFSQNVGIGLASGTNPAGKLDVKGDARFSTGTVYVTGVANKPPLFLSGGPQIPLADMTNKWNMTPGPTAPGPATLSFMSSNGNNGNGFGFLEADNVASPVVWMYDYGGKNAFTVAKKGYVSGGGDPTSISTALNPLFQVRVSGDVGIGTVNPAARLDVVGGAGARITDGANGALSFVGDSEGSKIVSGKLQGGNRNLRFMDKDLSNVERELVRFTSDGKVGIGTASPNAELEVDDNSDADNLANFFLRGGSGAAIRFFEGAAERVTIRSDASPGDFTIQTGGTATSGPSEKFRVRASGAVGIGTSDPQATLHVAGTAKIDGNLSVASINTHVWSIAPDYVFDENYELSSLDQVETYVKRNKHLPGVPSARQIKEKGIDIGEMNMTLLRKVEELTLHAIQQRKELEMQAKAMRDQARELAELKSRLTAIQK